MSGPLIAGIELGGTKCVCILARGPGDVLAELLLPTTTPPETLTAIRAVIDGWRGQHDVAAIGIASFGPLDLDPASPTFGRIVATTKPGWSDADLVRALVPDDLPHAIDTDVNGAALAEGLWGAARGLGSFAYITVGTGVGVGSIVSGRPVAGLGHSEAGHMLVPRIAGDDWAGACPYHGACVEGLASGPAIQAAIGGDPRALAADHPAWDRVVHALAAMTHNLVLTTLPQRVLIGGGIPTGRPELLPRIDARLRETLAGYAFAAGLTADFVAPPALGALAGPLGAIALGLSAVGEQIAD